MQSLFFLLALSALFELAVPLCVGRLRVFRFTACLIALGVVIGCTILQLQVEVSGITLFLAVLACYRLFNIARVLKGRMHEQYLERSVSYTTIWLAGSQAIVLLLAFTWRQGHYSSHAVFGTLLVFQLVFILACLITIVTYIVRSRLSSNNAPASDKSLPTISVLIPARNESEDLAECITTLLASQYPKLEIIVLDDCSQSTRTPDIIKSFAHDGVRFIQGSEPRQHWLAKNQAYDSLAQAANGEYLLFCGVDARFAILTLRRLIAYILQQQLDMVCVMPQNIVRSGGPMLVQPMRYLWELALPRPRTTRPPVLSTCWVINRKVLQQLGGFAAVARMIVPEAHFAKQLAKDKKYNFVIGGALFGLTSLKSSYEQRQTAVRVAYPQLHRRPEIVALVSLSMVAWLGIPMVAVFNEKSGLEISIGYCLVIFMTFLLYSLVLRSA